MGEIFIQFRKNRKHTKPSLVKVWKTNKNNNQYQSGFCWKYCGNFFVRLKLETISLEGSFAFVKLKREKISILIGWEYQFCLLEFNAFSMWFYNNLAALIWNAVYQLLCKENEEENQYTRTHAQTHRHRERYRRGETHRCK